MINDRKHLINMVNQESSTVDKIALFRSLFRGRDDIYPRRFENQKTQKSGYSPACANEWVRGVCEKPKIKCIDCQYRRFLPVTDDVVRWHLLGLDDKGKDFVIGVYPMLLDEKFIPYEDQWAFLSGLRKIARSEIEAVVEAAEAKGRTIGVRLEVSEEDNPTPWKAMPSRRQIVPIVSNLPEKIDLIIGNEIFIEKAVLSTSLRNRLIRLAAFQNPEFYEAQVMRLPVYQSPRVIGCAHDYSHHIGLPRGCLDDICQLFSDLKIKFTIQNEL